MKTIEKTTKATKATAPKKTPKLISVEKVATERHIIERYALITIRVPKVYADALRDPQGYCQVQSAGAEPGHEDWRIKQWHRGHGIGGGGMTPARKTHLAEIMKMNLDTPVVVPMLAGKWKAVGVVCKALGITKAEWMLAAVNYNGELALEKQKNPPAACGLPMP